MHDEPGRQEMPMPDDDVTLIRRVVNGDTAAFADLYRAHYRRLFAVCYRILGREAVAEDAVQDVFVKIYRALPAFRGDAAFRTWAYRIAVRHCLEVLRAMPTDISSDHLSEAVTPDTQDAALTSVQVHDALRTLSPVYRTVLTLRFFEELSLQEIARAMASSLPVVKMRLHRAKRHLARALQGVVAMEGLDHYLTHQAPTAPLPIPITAYKAAEMYAAFTAHLTAVQLAKSTAATTPLWQILLVGGMIAVMLVTGYRQHKARPATEISKTQTTALERPIKAAQLRVTTARGTAVDPLSGIDPTLVRNPRLQNGLNIDADSQRVEDILAAISRRVDVQLQADPQVADQLLFVRLHRMSAAGALTLIQRQLSLQWQVSGTTAAPVYTLAVTKQAAADIATAQKAQNKLARQEAINTIRTTCRMLDTRQGNEYELCAANFEWPSPNDLCKLPKDPAQWPDGYVLMSLLDDEVFTTLQKTGKWTASAAQLTKAERTLLCDSYTRGTGGLHQPLVKVEFELQPRDDGSVCFIAYATFADGGRMEPWYGMAYEAFQYRMRHFSDWHNIPQQISRMTAWAAMQNSAYHDQRLNTRWEKEPECALTPMALLRQLVDLTDLQIVSDDYTINQSAVFSIPRSFTLAERLAVMDRIFNFAWTLSPDNILTLRHRNWTVLRHTEPSKAVIDEAARTFRKRQAFTILDIGKLYGTHYLRNRATFTLLEQRLADDQVFQRKKEYYRACIESNGFLAAYSQLTPAERKAATDNPRGLSVMKLSPALQGLVIDVALRCDPDITRASALRRPWRLRIQHQRTNFNALTVFKQQHSIFLRGGFPREGTSVTTDYLVLDILDDSAGNCYRYALPIENVNGELYPIAICTV